MFCFSIDTYTKPLVDFHNFYVCLLTVSNWDIRCLKCETFFALRCVWRISLLGAVSRAVDMLGRVHSQTVSEIIFFRKSRWPVYLCWKVKMKENLVFGHKKKAKLFCPAFFWVSTGFHFLLPFSAFEGWFKTTWEGWETDLRSMSEGSGISQFLLEIPVALCFKFENIVFPIIFVISVAKVVFFQKVSIDLSDSILP